ncbi:MAG: hypothetical protein KC729_00200 [Candidatus Eisenbacteria bacterium]|uniref:Uncharacterized protein n=1 Tax=Eiseniibacteriota bacterium TaxID=2212470 RepID=A0A956RM56_UNCEI|nr:hypothetical protein [Candidatus Eisenbacteria bacterium]
MNWPSHPEPHLLRGGGLWRLEWPEIKMVVPLPDALSRVIDEILERDAAPDLRNLLLESGLMPARKKAGE